MQDTALLAIDWGTSTARAYAMDRQGRIRDARSAPLGVQRVAQGEFAQALKTLYGDDLPEGVPLIACGMIGSRQGWMEAPYCACPADFGAVAAALIRVPGTALTIVPGLICPPLRQAFAARCLRPRRSSNGWTKMVGSAAGPSCSITLTNP